MTSENPEEKPTRSEGDHQSDTSHHEGNTDETEEVVTETVKGTIAVDETKDETRNETEGSRSTEGEMLSKDTTSKSSGSVATPRQQEQEHESSWIPPTPYRHNSQNIEKNSTTGEGDSDQSSASSTLQLTPGAFHVGGLSSRETGPGNREGEGDDSQSANISDLAMVPHRYIGDTFSGVSCNSSANDTNLNSLVPVDRTPEHYYSTEQSQSNNRTHSLSSEAPVHDTPLLEAQVVSDHSMTIEERVNAEVEARLQSRLSTIATAEVIRTDGDDTQQGVGPLEQFSLNPPSPQTKRVEIDEDLESVRQTNAIMTKGNAAGGIRDDETIRRRRCLWIVLVVLAVLGVVGTLAGIFLIRSDGDTVTPATVAPNLPPMPSEATVSQRFVDMQQALSEITSTDVLEDVSSPQHSALLWLVYDDGLQMKPNSTYDLYQRYILTTLYFSTEGRRWKNQCRFLSATPVCDWQVTSIEKGVFCGNESFVVESLHFENNGLRGSIPPEIVYLKSMVFLGLYDNDIQGKIPDGISFLTNLSYLNIERNLFSNSLPTELSSMTRLETFLAGANRFTGYIPDLKLLTNLVNLSLGDNRLSGLNAFPGDPDFAIVPELLTVRLELNRLNGPLDDSICNLLNLRQLSLYANELTSIPTCLENLEMLETVFIDRNAITGSVDSIFCPIQEGQIIEADCVNEVQCSCCTSCCDGPDNQCLARSEAPTFGPENSTSTFPSSPQDITEGPTTPPANVVPTSPPITLNPSEYLGRRYEAVRDVLLQVSTRGTLDNVSSPQYATMEWIVEMDQAQIPPTDENTLLTRYVVSLLYFAMNGDEWWQDFGFLDPSSICTWNDGGNNGCYCDTNGTQDILTKIALFQNNLRGRIPDEIFFLEDLEFLHLDGNAISGVLSPSINSFSNLRYLTMDYNLITGGIPSELGDLSLLEVLRLNQNKLEKSIPSEIGRLTRLRDLFLQDNSITGTVPSDLQNLMNWESIRLENNSLRGTLDPIFCPLESPNIDLWADCRLGVEIDCSCCTFCCDVVLGCLEN